MAAESGTTTTPAPAESSATQAPAAPASGMGGAVGATPSQPSAWSLDAWKQDDWDGLPEPIRKAADARYQPQLAERDRLVAQHQAEVAAAKKAAEDARAQWVKGNPFGAEDLKKAQAELEALRAEHEGYKTKYNDGILETRAKEWQAKWDEAAKTSTQKYAERIQRELEVQFPWSVPGSPTYDKVAMGEADRLAELLDNTFGLTEVPDAVILTVAKLNEAQRHTFVRELGNDRPWKEALLAAQKPPEHTPSPAARATSGANAAVRPSRPMPGGQRFDRSALRSAATEASGAQGRIPRTS